ncbi:MAG: ParM/StbA family protein [Clostridia bacterium]
MKHLRRIKNKIEDIIRKFKYRKIKKFNNSNETVFVDLGASSIKMSYKGELITFRSSIRKVYDNNEITIQKNSINVNGQWFIVGESTQPTGNYEYKYEKEHLEILILFGLSIIKEKVKSISNDLKVNILLPYNQIHTKKQLSNRIDGVYQVRNNLHEFDLSLTLNKVFVEGETSKVYFEKNYNTGGNTCVVNIGYSTTDIALYNTLNCREQITSINIGTNNLLSQYLKYTKAPTSSVLNTWLNDGYTFNKEEYKNISMVNEEYIKTLWNDIYNGVIKLSNPGNTNVVFCGGGALLLLNEFKQSIPREYNIKVLNDIECIYSDLLGMILLSNEKVNIENYECDYEPEPPRKNKVSNFDKFKELKEQGYTNEEIIRITNLAPQTIRNYQSKLNKLKIAS